MKTFVFYFFIKWKSLFTFLFHFHLFNCRQNLFIYLFFFADKSGDFNYTEQNGIWESSADMLTSFWLLNVLRLNRFNGLCVCHRSNAVRVYLALTFIIRFGTCLLTLELKSMWLYHFSSKLVAHFHVVSYI